MAHLRFPHLHGDTLVLTAEDDVWTAPLGGGRAYRLTADSVPVSTPRISPDGTRVAWGSRRDGARETYVADVGGGPVTRLTYWGDPAGACAGWTPEGEVVALTSSRDATGRRWAHALPASGGAPRLLPYGPLAALAFDAGTGAVAVLSHGAREAAWWKRYRGGTAGRIWLDPDGSGRFGRVGAELDGQFECPMLVASEAGTRLAFLSDHEGWGNVYSLALDGGDLRRHSDHGGDGAPAFYARHASTDGRRVVYESAGSLWLLDSLDAGAAPRPLEVTLGGPRTAREPFRATISRDLGGVHPDRAGRTSIVTVRGTVHRLTHRDGPARTLLAEPGVRARMARPLGEDRAVWVDDAEGADAVCVAPLDGRAEGAAAPRRHGAGEIGRVLELEPAPDGSAVALSTHDGRLLVLDLGAGAAEGGEPAAGTLRELARGGAGEVADLSWSPDSRWLAFCDPPEPGLSRIVLARVADGELVEVTPARFHDSDPVFTSDGRYLAFLSRRVFDPSYDHHAFDLAFQTGWKPFLVPLGARTPSPFGASPDGRPVTAGEEGPTDPPAPSRRGGTRDGDAAGADADVPAEETPAKKDAAAPPEVVVDVEGLAERVVGIPVEAGHYYGMTAGKGCLLWLHHPASGVLGDSRADDDAEHERPWLERYDLAKRTLTTIADPGGPFAVSGDGTRVVVRDRAKLRVLRTDRSSAAAPSEDDNGSSDEFDIDTGRLVVTVDPAAEWRQMFDEAARLMRDHFWVEDMAGVDWDAEVARYRPLVEQLGSHDDLVDLLWELHGELGTSHAYVIPTRPAGDATGRPGLLGADLEPVGAPGGADAPGAGWRVRRVLPPESSAPAARSPLSGPGVDVRAGDVIH